MPFFQFLLSRELNLVQGSGQQRCLEVNIMILLLDAAGKTQTNHAGGIVGGITNGNDLVFRVVVKPTSSTPKEQESWNWETEQVEKFSVKGRHDLCITLRVPPVLEAVTAIVLADFMLMEQKIKRVN